MSEAVFDGWHLRRPTRGHGIAGGILALLLTVACVTLALDRPAPPPVAPPAPAPPRNPAWIDIARPIEIYSLEARALRALPFAYTARRLEDGTERQDVLGFGTLAGSDPALRLRLYRRAGAPAPLPLFPALAREAADAGLAVLRTGLPGAMPTRFGGFDVADVTLAAATPRACSGFRLALVEPALTMTGLACGTAAHPLTRPALGCLLDRLDLASAGDDDALILFFARTELARNSTCSGARLGPDQVHAAWLDDAPATSRKSLRRH